MVPGLQNVQLKPANATQTSRAVLDVVQSATGRFWQHRGDDAAQQAAAIASAHAVPEVIARILAARGYDVATAGRFLDPSLKNELPNPSVLKDMDKAAARLASAVRTGEKVAIFGDYDVDGATSTALLKRYFAACGLDVIVYIPDRMREGYGPNIDAILKLKAEEGITLLVTVDCGITAFDVIGAASESGLDVIILDHHKAEPELPHCFAAVNPNRVDEDGSLSHLAAVGVSFLTAVAVNRALRQDGWFNDARPEPRLTSFLDIVALGTVCDVVPLTGVNRAFVAQGLKVMAMGQNPGMRALMDVAGFSDTPDAFCAGFVLGPRVNAGGRVGESYLGSRLLASDDAAYCADVAAQLNGYNVERRALETVVTSEALAQVEHNAVLSAGMCILLAGDGWHPGVIGIAAARLKEKFNKPVIVIGCDEKGTGKGSGRSVPGVDLGAAVIAARQAGLLVAGGGHAMAAGLTVEKDQIDRLRSFIDAHINEQLAGQELVSALNIDGVTSVSGLTVDFIRQLDRLAPYGAGHSEPRFVLSGVRISRAETMGENHARCYLQDSAGGGSVKGVSFRCVDTPLGRALLKESQGRMCHVAGYARINRWMGRESVDFHISDIAFV